MDWLYFTQVSLGALTLIILLMVITVYLARIRDKKKSTIYLMDFYLGMVLLNTAGFFAVSIHSSLRLYFFHFEFLIASVALIALLQFAYHFIENFNPRESKRALVVSSVLGGGISLHFIYSLLVQKVIEQGQVMILASLLFLEFLWVLSVFIRKTFRLSRMEGWSKRTRGVSNLSLLMIIAVLVSFSTILFQMGFFSAAVNNFIFGNGSLLFFFLFVLFYLNSTEELTSFMVKLSGMTLVTVLFILGLVSFIFTLSHEQSYDQMRRLEVKLCKEKVESKNLDKIPNSVVYITSHLKAQGMFSDQLLKVYSRKGWGAMKQLVSENVALTKRILGRKEGLENPLQMNRIGRLTQNSVSRTPQFLSYRFTSEDSIYEVGFDHKDYKEFIHRGAVVFVYVIALVSLFVLVAFPLFFRANIVNPLSRLLEGVRKVNQKDLDVRIPIRMRDEIGYLSSSFNGMVQSIQRSKQQLEEYNQKLEETVAERTRDLKFKNEKILSSIRYAERMQKTILPPRRNLDEWLGEYFLFYRPKDIVSGDFFWISKIEDQVITAVVDCTGHGVPGALMSMMGNMLLNTIVNEKGITQPFRILELLHMGIRRIFNQERAKGLDLTGGMDVAVCNIQRAKRILQFAGAKRPLYIAHKSDHHPSFNGDWSKDHFNLLEVKGDRKSIGSRSENGKILFTQRSIEITPGEMIYLTSDGYPDQNNGEGDKIGTRKFREWLTQVATQPVSEQKEILNLELETHMQGEEQRDDITILGIRI